VGQAFAQIEAYITNEGINLKDVPALIMIVETAFEDPNHVVIVEPRLEVYKETNHDFFTYYAEFQCYAANL
jgi:hypothetical protein